MTDRTDLRENIAAALFDFQRKPPAEAARQLLATLGYRGSRTLSVSGVDEFIEIFDPSDELRTRNRAFVEEWESIQILFQLTDDDLSGDNLLFRENRIEQGLMRSYLFFHIALKGASYPRSKLAQITRQINRRFSMPVMVFFTYGTTLSIAVINRRRNKLDAAKDVLGKVTLIHGISQTKPHRGHLDIFKSLAVSNLVHPQRLPIKGFDALHAAWEQIFNVELLNERFYRELANWYFWALPQVEFPNDTKKDNEEKHQASSLIRLLTRLIFCWFLKEKNLIPEKLFESGELAKMLKDFDPESEVSSSYYQAILQNLFFATLNQRMHKDSNGKPYRKFVFDESFVKNRSNHDLNNYFRYESLFAISSDDALALFEDIPFLNGGLFECLDKRDEDQKETFYLDGFSRIAKKRPHVPDRLFFDSGETANLSTAYGDTKRKAERVTGLITILNRYKFTIVENTPIDQEIALDPELLGKVFENLLASYNEETKTTARKQTGSFYTPRPIVDYMVDESLKAYLERNVAETILSRSSILSRSKNVDETILSRSENVDETILSRSKNVDETILSRSSIPSHSSPPDTIVATTLQPYNPEVLTAKTRHNLPHWSQEGTTYWITFRLADSLPQEKLAVWRAERDAWVRHHPEPWSDTEWEAYHKNFGERLEGWLDAGGGECHLRRPEIRDVIERCLSHFDGIRYDLGPWVIMPNHVHLLLRPGKGQNLSKILQGIKGVSAKECNALLERTGQPFWQEESFDHIVRSQAQFDRFVRYIAENPIKARLKPGEYRLSESSEQSSPDNQRSPDNPVGGSESGSGLSRLRYRLDHLFSYTEEPHLFDDSEVATLITAIDKVKILDPACGSGAFPMGVLHKLVYILGKLDPDNERWKQTQLAKLDSAPMRDELERAFADNNDDYGRKLYLIENCLYGVDIQPIAIQISKLRFFISLVCDQKTNRNKKENHGIRPLPNLETKFVAADSLIGLPIPEPDLFIRSVIEPIEKEIEQAYHRHFAIQRRDQKLALQKRIKNLRLKLADAIVNGLGANKDAEIIKKAHHVAEWDPFDPQASADFFDPHWMFGRSLKDGFDIVIGNPPYIQIQNFSGQVCQKRWEEQNYQTYAKTGDLYGLFYERGYNLLNQGGILMLITSNKWMRAAYGKALRSFMLNNGRLHALIDFGDSTIFEAATTYTNILVWAKTPTPQTPPSPTCYDLKAVYEKQETLPEMMEVAGPSGCLLNEDAFVVISPEWTRLKQRVEELGTPLRDWNILINYGIKTGCNEAFIVPGKTRNELIAADPRSAEILKPILRGRDIKRYAAQFADLWMIATFPAQHIEIGQYPAVKDYLLKFGKRLEQSGEPGCRKKTANQWFEVQDTIAYHEEFSKEKLIYAEIVYDSAFYYDAQGYAPEATSFIMTGERVKYLAALLNSRFLTEVFKRFYAGGDLRGNTFRYKKAFLEPLPVPQLDEEASRPFEILVDCVQHARANEMQREAEQIEAVIDGLVYDLYFEQELRTANCFITERIREVVQPFNQSDNDAFKTEYIQTLCDFFRNDKTVRHALIHRKTVYPVTVILGATL